MVIWHLRQIGKFDKWVPRELAKKKKKKIVILKCCLILNHFLIGLWHAAKSEFYTTTHNDQLSDWIEKKLQSTPQSQICTKKRSWSLFSGLLPVRSTAAFWIPAKPLHLRSMLIRWMKCTKTTTPADSIGQQKGPDSSPQGLTTHLITSASNVQWTGLWSFALSAIFTRHLDNWLPLLQASQQLFAGKMLPQWAGGWKCFLRIHRILKHGFLCYRNKPTYCWQKYVDCNGSYFDY